MNSEEMTESADFPYLHYETVSIRKWRDQGYSLKALESRASALAEADILFEDVHPPAVQIAHIASVGHAEDKSSATPICERRQLVRDLLGARPMNAALLEERFLELELAILAQSDLPLNGNSVPPIPPRAHFVTSPRILSGSPSGSHWNPGARDHSAVNGRNSSSRA